MTHLFNSENMKTIMKRIQERRLELKLSYQDLAVKTNMSKSTLQRYETGSIKNMPIDKLEIIANALNVDPVWLLGLQKQEKPSVNNNLSKEEKEHIEDLRKLNDLGKKKVFTYTKDLIEMPKYQKQIWEEEGKEHLMPIACHDDNLSEEEKNMMNSKIEEYLKNHK
ncbi:helix-turn-helix domain-containing protein [Clostridium fallax]|uniref:Transcriptional regulator, contains XRE-family HTH domain n=1 Tax=Clostridium fallax TaxID=1533 RepID=A0A1M4UXI7_9CLOT|nr:helix-turn-helix transcriptional regulator [Clostridium fallax]SHE61379.1 Transcriptional regulator, contains XRE-family HTH domain [Clostridium fallax]SQB06761.1 Cro/CI family transcriptional regulator [Clostridium fallax]